MRIAIARACVALAVVLSTAACDQKPIVAPALVIAPAESSAHQIGRYATGEEALVAEPGMTGFLHYGPYAELAPGAYQAVFELSVAGASGPAGVVDVNAFVPDKPIDVQASSTLVADASHRRVALDFTALSGVKYEYRVASNGTAKLKLHSIVVKRRQ